MPSSFRSPRSLASWFELDYHRRRGLFRGWWRGSLLLAALASLLVLGVMIWAAGNRTFQAGPLSAPHAMFNNRCDLCHENHGATLTRLWRGDGVGSIPDRACLQCHAAPAHNHPHATMDRCVHCHKEHRGHSTLLRIDDRRCVECHRDLRRADESTPAFATSVTAFAEGQHPPFRTREDPGTLRFNHKVHLADLRLRDKSHKLACDDCHRTDATGRYMEPISFEQHCKKCHPITIQISGGWQDLDRGWLAMAFASEPLPHPRKGQSMDDVRGVLRDRVARFITSPGGEQFLRESGRPSRLPLLIATPREEKAFAWVNRTVEELGSVLFTGAGGCRYCHSVSFVGESGRPTLAAPAVPVRWWEHAKFRHDAHRMLSCEECHQPRDSTRTSDVLLPTMEKCLKCHGRSAPGATARADCFECHVYHDPQEQKRERHKRSLTIDELLKR